MSEVIKEWQDKLEIPNWDITTEKIEPEQIMYGGEDYFVGIVIDWDNQSGVIYHDIDLTEDAVIHELLHVRYKDKDEDWINETTKQHLHSKYRY